VPTFDLVGSGGIYASVEDLFLWDQNFYHNRLGKGGEDFIRQILTPGRFNNGKLQDYAFGLVVRSHRGLPVVEHAGGTGGYRAQLVRFPEQRFSVILLSNYAMVDSTDMAQKVADIFLEEQYPEKPPIPPSAVTLSEEELQEKCGHYFSRKAAAVGEITCNAGALLLSLQGLDIPLEAYSRRTLHSVNFPLSFGLQFRRQKNRVFFELHTAGDTEPVIFEKIEVQPMDAGNLQALCGTYASDELESGLQLLLEGEDLWLKIPHQRLLLKPSVRDMFYHEAGILEVQRSRSGTIRSLHLSSGRAHRVRFTRLKK